MIKQGHKYQYNDMQVLALENTANKDTLVSELEYSMPYFLGKSFMADSSKLKALPMKYYHGEIPK